MLSENQDLNNKLISKEKEINKKLINVPNIENISSNETFSEIYNFEEWMKTKTNLSESSVNKYVNSVSNMRLDLIRIRNVDIFNSLNQDQENLEKLLDIWLTENLEKDRKGNNMYSAGFRKFIIFKSFNDGDFTLSLTYTPCPIPPGVQFRDNSQQCRSRFSDTLWLTRFFFIISNRARYASFQYFET